MNQLYSNKNLKERNQLEGSGTAWASTREVALTEEVEDEFQSYFDITIVFLQLCLFHLFFTYAGMKPARFILSAYVFYGSALHHRSFDIISNISILSIV